ncbi:MAG: hypothetical protein UGF45_03645 [Massilioclostridium sp.]|nr:hypothetical protein [Massilioclostridium sp.]MEE1491121.1 hypothetical protein [Massilioclostridium sp.]
MTKTNVKFSERYAPRYFIAWILIACILLGVIGAVLYNINAVMMLFGKGNIHLRPLPDIQAQVTALSEQYNVTGLTQNPDGSVRFEYAAKNNVASFSILSETDGKKVSQINGQIDLSAFDLTQITEIYSFVDSLVKPLCRERDILAAEVALLKIAGKTQLIRYETFLYQEHVVDDKFITLRKEKDSYVIELSITPM